MGPNSLCTLLKHSARDLWPHFISENILLCIWKFLIIMVLNIEVFLQLYLFPYFSCMYASRCTYMHYMCAGCHRSQKRAFEVNGNDGPLCGCWELDLGPQQEQWALTATRHHSSPRVGILLNSRRHLHHTCAPHAIRSYIVLSMQILT